MANVVKLQESAQQLAERLSELPRGRKYTVAFDDGSSEAGIPLDRIRRDNSPAPARPEGRAGDAAAPEAAVAAEAAAVVSPEAVEVRTGE